jgi:hypothetical protein
MMKALDPFDLRCGVCGKMIENTDEQLAIIDHPFEKNQSMIVHCRHSGIAKVVKDPVQLTTGRALQKLAWRFRERLCPEETLKVINTVFGLGGGKGKGNMVRYNREW